MRATCAKANTTACLLFVAMALGSGSRAFAQSLIEGPEFRVNALTENYQRNPSVATDRDGDFVVVWESSVGSSGEIVAQRFDPLGRRKGNEMVVSPRGFRARAGMNGDGDFVVRWEDGFAPAAHVQRFDRSGLPQGNSFDIVGSPTGGDVRVRDDGSFVVVSSDDGDVTGQRFDRRGLPIGETIEVGGEIDGWFPDMAMSSAGEFVVAWSRGYSQYWGVNLGNGILAQRFDQDGNTIGEPLAVQSGRTDYAPPAVALGSDGSLVIAWSETRTGGFYDVFVRRFDRAGDPVGGELLANTYTPGSQELTDVAVAPDGSFFVVWRSDRQDGDGGGVFGQAFDRQGDRLGAEFQVSGYTLGHQTRASVAFDRTGRLVVAWHTDQRDGSGAEVFAKLYRRDGIAGPDTDADGVEDAIDNCPTLANADQVDVASDGMGDACVAPDAMIHPTARLGANPIIGRRSIVGSGVSIGDDSYVGEEVRFDRQARAGDRVRVGDRVVVGSRAFLGSDVAIGADGRVDPGATIGDAATIGDGVIVGRNVSIGPRVTIAPLVILDVGARVGRGATLEMGARVGRRAVVAAGALLPAGTTVPAGTRFP